MCCLSMPAKAIRKTNVKTDCVRVKTGSLTIFKKLWKLTNFAKKNRAIPSEFR